MIVLLILAGITISAISGENGIIQKAVEAKEETEKAEKEEKEKLGDMEDTINEYATRITVEQVTDENPGILEGTGTDDDPYTINSIEDLVYFSYDVNNGNTYEGKTVKLGLSLDFNSNKSYVEPLRTDYGRYGYDGELKILLTTGEGFKPIGTYLNTNTSVADKTNIPFMGTFDGNGYKIDGMRIVSEEKGKGLFGLVNNGIVRNLTIGENCNIDVRASFGSIAGYLYNNANIENCINEATIKAHGTNTGGIVGTSTAGCIVTKCSNKGIIQGTLTVGGIVGNNEGNILYCYNLNTINSESSVGGICGVSTGRITESYNIASIVSETTNVGGIVGLSQGNGNTDSCYNMGSITGTGNNVGGIIGLGTGNSQLSNSYSAGYVISSNNSSGGIVGYNESISVSNCYYLMNSVNDGNDITIIDGIEFKTEEELKNIAETLGVAFKEDINNVNNGYPLLNWQ